VLGWAWVAFLSLCKPLANELDRFPSVMIVTCIFLV
jgi:hypothetical protein